MSFYDDYDKSLYRISTDKGVLVYDVPAEDIASGQVTSILTQAIGNLASGKNLFDNTETGYILGLDEGVAKFFIGNDTNYLNWDGSALTISGALSASSGTIGGFSIGSDYIRDAANTFGLSFTVTGGYDIRFW